MSDSLIGGIILFPVWWYTHGLALVSRWVASSVKAASAYLSLGVWMKNLFVPMYGDNSFAGRAISFGVRFVMVILRGIGVAVWALVALALWVLYIVSLPLSVVGVLYHLIGMMA